VEGFRLVEHDEVGAVVDAFQPGAGQGRERRLIDGVSDRVGHAGVVELDVEHLGRGGDLGQFGPQVGRDQFAEGGGRDLLVAVAHVFQRLFAAALGVDHAVDGGGGL